MSSAKSQSLRLSCQSSTLLLINKSRARCKGHRGGRHALRERRATFTNWKARQFQFVSITVSMPLPDCLYGSISACLRGSTHLAAHTYVCVCVCVCVCIYVYNICVLGGSTHLAAHTIYIYIYIHNIYIYKQHTPQTPRLRQHSTQPPRQHASQTLVFKVAYHNAFKV